MIKNVIKRDGSIEAFDISKIIAAISKAFPKGIIPYPEKAIESAVDKYLPDAENVDVEFIQEILLTFSGNRV